MSRFPRSVFDHGADPDPRFSLANERTFLAWVRTGIAMIAGSIAIHVPIFDLPDALRLAMTAVLLVGALVCIGEACRRWMRTEQALRGNGELPGFGGPMVLMVVLLALAACVVALAVLA